MVRLLGDPPSELIDDLRYDPLSAFIAQRLDQGFPNSRERPAGVSGLGPAESPLDPPPMGCQPRDRLVVLARVRIHGASRSGRSDDFKAGSGPPAWEATMT